MENNIIQVGPSDELASIIDKILEEDSDIIFLEVSDDAYIAQNVLNFRLLKREADNADKTIVIVSENRRIKDLASKASLQTRTSLPTNLDSSTGSKKAISRPMSVIDIVPPQDILKKNDSGDDLPREQDVELISPLDTPATEDLPKRKTKKRDEFLQSISLAKPKENIEEEVLEGNSESDESIVKKINNYADNEGQKDIFYKKPKRRDKKIGPKLSGLFVRIKRNPKRWAIYTLSSAVIGVGLFFLVFVLPSASVKLFAQTFQDNLNTNVLMDSNISSANLSARTIPAQLIEEVRENNFTFEATGEADIEESATGQIRVYNEYNSSPQTLVANTRFLSSGGLLFRTVETVVVPGASVEGGKVVANSILVNVVADEAGSEFNIEPTAFSIPGFKGTDKYLAFYGKSETAMEGGFKGKTTVVTQDDIDNAVDGLNQNFLQEVGDTLKEKIPDNLIVIEDTFESKFETLDIGAVAGEPKTEFSIRVRAVARAFLVKQEDILDLVEHYFVNSAEYSAEFELSDERTIEYVVKEIDYGKGYASVDLNITQVFNKKLDITNLHNEIRGKNESEVRRILLNKDGLEEAQIRFWPFWVRKIPNDVEKINISVEHKEQLIEE